MTARTIIIRQVASKHSNFVVTEYISCRPQSLVLDVLNEKNVDVSQFGVKSCERGENTQTMSQAGLGWLGLRCVFVYISVSNQPKQSPCLWSSDFGQPLSIG